MRSRILIIDDEESVRYSFIRFLNTAGYQIATARNGADALQIILNEKPFDLIILDIRLPDISGMEIFKRIRQIDPKSVVLVITAFGTTEIAIEATQLGAYDYILKPFDMPAMKSLIDEAVQSGRLMRTQVVIDSTEEKTLKGDRIIGNSPVMHEVYKMIGRVSGIDVNILLRGETGTGKELVARAIYQHSKRSQHPFLTVNCAAIPENLLESELFGYEKGAFTGAYRRKIGKFEQVSGGTIFLDEIGDMTLSTQAKILRILQEGCFEHLGGNQLIHVDVHVIAATHRNLEKAIEQGLFREDLYYRIKVVTITLPPLRLRAEDIPDLAEYFIIKYRSVLGKEKIAIPDEAIHALQDYHWPGNIREMENIIKRAMILSKGNLIQTELIVEEFKKSKPPEYPEVQDETNCLINRQDMEKYRGSYYHRVMSQTEKNLILQVLRETRGNQVQASKILGISRVKLHDRLIQYGISKNTLVYENTP